jgi:WD40 repeat protein
VHGAIAQTADHLYEDLDEDRQRVTRDIMLRLTALGQGTEDTRRRVTRSELGTDPATVEVLDRLATARLITLGEDTVEMAHEAVIRSWPLLQSWLVMDRETVMAHRRLTEAAAEWDSHGRDESLLYRGARLDSWRESEAERLNDLEREFLTAGRGVVEQEHRSRRRRLRWTVGSLVSATALVAVLAVVSLLVAANAEHNRDLATSRQLVTEARIQSQTDPELGLLLAREAFTTAPGDAAEATLRQAMADSHLRAVLPDSGGTVCRVAFSPDGGQLASLDNEGRLRVWDMTGEIREIARSAPREQDHPHCPGGGTGPVFSADGTRIAGTYANDELWTWDWTREGAPLTRTDRRPAWDDAIDPIVFSPGLDRVATVSRRGDILIWPASGDDPPLELRTGDQRVSALRFSQDGRQLTSVTDDGTVRVWDLAGGGDEVVRQGDGERVVTVAISSDGRRLAAGSRDGTVTTSDIASGAGPVVLGGHDGYVYDLSFSADGKWLVSTGDDGLVQVWNAHQRAAPAVLRGPYGAVRTAVPSPDGRTVVTVNEHGAAHVWAVDEVDVLTVVPGGPGSVPALVASADGRRVAVSWSDGSMQVRDTAGNSPPATLTTQESGDRIMTGGGVPPAVFSPDGRFLASRYPVRLWNVDDLTKPVEIPVPFVDSLAFGPDGERIVVVTRGAAPSIRNVDGTGATTPLPVAGLGPEPDLGDITWSPDGHHIAATTGYGTVLLWDLRKRTGPVVLPGGTGHVSPLVFSADSARLVSARTDGTVHVWDVPTPGDPVLLRGHQGGTWSVAFLAGSRRLVTTGNDATVRFWDIEEHAEPLALNGFRASVTSVAPLSDDRFVSAHGDGTVRTWRCPACAPVDEVLAHVDEHVSRDLTEEEREIYLSAG